MKKPSVLRLIRSSLLASTALLAPAAVFAQSITLVDGNNGVLPTPPGLYVTPVAPLTAAVQQQLNPGLAAYPNFVAGEAVKAVLSPDGTTLAVPTRGMNALYNSARTIQTAPAPHVLSPYNVACAHKA